MKILQALAAAAAFLAFAAQAQDAESIKAALKKKFPEAPVDAVRKIPYGNLYEVQGGGELFYTDDKTTFLLVGALIDTRTKENMTELRTLFLYSNNITDAGVAALAESPQLARLQRVFLHRNRIRDAGAEALAGSPYLQDLQEMYLGENQISDLAADKLRARFGRRVNVH